jgi:hypothetical protein
LLCTRAVDQELVAGIVNGAKAEAAGNRGDPPATPTRHRLTRSRGGTSRGTAHATRQWVMVNLLGTADRLSDRGQTILDDKVDFLFHVYAASVCPQSV